MRKLEDGPVVYNPTICIGCRYCMIACPFEILAYEYSKPLTPKVKKCQFCIDTNKEGIANPACAAACPTEAMENLNLEEPPGYIFLEGIYQNLALKNFKKKHLQG